MKTSHAIPILDIDANDRLWLTEVYKDAKQSKRSDAQEIWGRLFDTMPNGYRPDNIDSRLLRGSGEHIKVPGVIAIENKRTILKKIDKVIYQIRKVIAGNTKIEDISLTEVAKAVRMSIKEVNFCFQLASEYLTLSRGGSCEFDSNIYTSIRVSGDISIFYNYRDYQGIEKIVLNRLAAYQAQTKEYFDNSEKLLLTVQIDSLKEDLTALKLGQEIIWTDFTDQMNELKEALQMPKKSWKQFLLGKLFEMTVSGVISETVSKKIIELLSPHIGMIANSIIKFLN